MLILARIGTVLGITVAFITAPGCGSGRVSGTPAARDAVLEQVTRAYVSHLRMAPNRPPADEAEFKKILTQAGDAILQRAGVNTIDELLVSPRDKKPFMIAYGKDAIALLDRGIVAYERAGVSGRRLVGYSLGYVSEVDDATFNAQREAH